MTRASPITNTHPKAKRGLSCDVSQQVHERISAIAKAKGVSVGAMLREMVMAALGEEKKG